MDIALMIIGIVALGFVINVLLKQTYNFIFFLGQKPFLWVATVAVVGIALWGISRFFELSVNVPAWASVMALVMSWPPSYSNSEDKNSAQRVADEVYAEMGLKHGRLLYKVGLGSFVLSCLGSWIVFYGEVCSGNECQSIVENVF